MAQFKEVRCTFYNELNGLWYVDAWKTMKDDEEGKVVATINPKTFEVKYRHKNYKEDNYIHQVIKEKLQDIVKY